MVAVLGTVEVDPSDRDAFVSAARALESATRAEAGCVRYAFGQDLAAPNLFWLSEIWSNADMLRAHLQTPHIAAFRDAIGSLKLRFQANRYDLTNESVLISR